MIVALIIVDHVKTANGLENQNCSTKKGIMMESKRIDINRYDENYMTHSDSLILIPVLLFPRSIYFLSFRSPFSFPSVVNTCYIASHQGYDSLATIADHDLKEQILNLFYQFLHSFISSK